MESERIDLFAASGGRNIEKNVDILHAGYPDCAPGPLRKETVATERLRTWAGNRFRGMRDSRWNVFGIIPACLLGIASPLCMYGTIPIAASFSKQGMRDDWLAAFMMAGPATKITNLGAVKIVLGMKRFVLYWAFTILFALTTGLAVNLIL